MCEHRVKRCINPLCEQPQPLPATAEYFHRHSGRPDGLYGLCKLCNRKQAQERRERIRADGAQKSTPLTPPPHGTPDQCAVCGTTAGNIIADVDEVSKRTRGYLCSKCFRVLNSFQADPRRIRAVADYIEQSGRQQEQWGR